MKYRIIFIYIFLVLISKNLSAYKEKDLHHFLYFSNYFSYDLKNLSIWSFYNSDANRFKNSRFGMCDFALCTFQNFVLSNVEFHNCDFFGANFMWMNLSTTTFYNCDMRKSNFSKCNVNGTRFIICNGFTKKQKNIIKSCDGIIIETVIKITSIEEFEEIMKIINAASTVNGRRDLHKVLKCLNNMCIIMHKPLSKKIKEAASRIKNKISETINKIHNASMRKTRKRIQNIYNH